MTSTNHVLGETWTFIRRRRGHAGAVRVLDALNGSQRVTVIRVDQDVEEDAWEWLRRHDDREYSLSMPPASPSCDGDACAKRWHSTMTSFQLASSKFDRADQRSACRL